jgi:type II restriction/modification system DNA methylase subunit YeeA
MPATPESLEKFVNFCQEYISGKERKEAQIFLDRFFQAFGYPGALEAGAKYEEPIKKGSQKKNTGFADLVWKPKLLIEMKKRSENLNKHYPQAFEYWLRLVPNRPQYVILCNFDEFWIFDFDLQLDEPVDIISLTDLSQRGSAFNFMELGNLTPVFRNNQVQVTETAARWLGELYQILQTRLTPLTPFNPPLVRGEISLNPPLVRGNLGGLIQSFILQCVLAMFAEDRGLLPRDLFISCVQECLNGATSYDVFTGLFQAMNTPGITSTGKYQGVEYFNGGLFKNIYPIELNQQELELLETIAKQDWSKVRPAIFGNIFEGTVNQKERHSYGIHYTSEADIMKIVRPTISKYWEDLIDSADTIKDLNQLQLQLQNYRVLDPACGSGNFLYIAYQELKRIEHLLLDKLAQKSGNSNQLKLGFVTPNQFYGMDLNPFAVELAKVTLMIARKVAIDKLNLTEPALPLDTLDNNIICTDALFTDWIKTDAIIGNPPFLGGHRLRQELGDKYVNQIIKQFPDVKDKVDFCTYWFRLAHNNINQNGRCGLVATNSIGQGNNRRASLDYITQNQGYIYNATSSQKWSGEAAVYVSIVNWCYQQQQECLLDGKKVAKINSSLRSDADVSLTKPLKANKNLAFKGVQPTGKGFIITPQQAQKWIEIDPKNQEVLKPFLDAKDLASIPNGYPSRWIIDFNDLCLEDASNYTLPFEYIKVNVKPERDKNRRETTRLNWWKFGEKRPEMRKAISKLSCYFAIPRVSKWFIFLPADLHFLAGDSTVIVAEDDFYILGILTSKIHRMWLKLQCSTLGETTRYTHNSCFETFPFPQLFSPISSRRGVGGEVKIVIKIREIMTKLHEYRTEQMEQKQWGITQLYNQFFNEPTSKLSKLHRELDELVMQAYGFQEGDDLLEKLFNLNLELAAKEAKGEVVISANIPDFD